MKVKSLHELLVAELKDLYSAEQQLVKALPKMAKEAQGDALREAIEAHLEETQTHVERLDQIFEMLEESPGRKKCKAMEGLLEEAKEHASEASDEVKDASIIASAQRVEHYEMAGYGCARTFARLLGLDDIAEILQQTLDE